MNDRNVIYKQVLRRDAAARTDGVVFWIIWGAYHLTEKSGWGVESIMVSDLPVYRRNATSVTVWIQKKGEFVSRESGTEKELRNWLMVSNIPFGSYQPEWKDYLKMYSSIFSWNFRKWPYHLPSIRNFRNFPSNGKHPWIVNSPAYLPNREAAR